MSNLTIQEKIPGLSTESLLYLRSVRGLRKAQSEQVSAMAQKELKANGLMTTDGKFSKGLWDVNDDILLQETLDFRLEREIRAKQKEERMGK